VRQRGPARLVVHGAERDGERPEWWLEAARPRARGAVLGGGTAAAARVSERAGALAERRGHVVEHRLAAPPSHLAGRLDPEVSWAMVVAPREGHTLYALHPHPAPPLRAMVRGVAHLGGCFGRTADGDPGIPAIWPGEHRLAACSEAVAMLQPVKALSKCIMVSARHEPRTSARRLYAVVRHHGSDRCATLCLCPPTLLHWNDRRRSLILHKKHEELGRLGVTRVLRDTVDVMR
jgi:hypothetical protein